MRDIKFRAWDKKEKKMTTEFVLAPTSPTWGAFPIRHSEELNKYQDIIRKKIGVIDEDWKFQLLNFISADYTLTDWANFYGLENYIVMQYTGLKDKNGREIYEGDIVKRVDGTTRLLIVWYKSGFHFAWTEKEISSPVSNPSYFEVIGNVWENKELLNGSSGL